MKSVVPIVMRMRGEGIEVLAARDPTTGTGFAKGPIADGEAVETAAVRVLHHTSGVMGRANRTLMTLRIQGDAATLALVLCDATIPYDHFMHEDEATGDLAIFYWHPMAEEPDETWDAVNAKCLAELSKRYA